MRRWIAPFLLAAVCLAVGAAATALAEGKGRFVMDRLQAFAAPPPPADRPRLPRRRSRTSRLLGGGPGHVLKTVRQNISPEPMNTCRQRPWP